MALPALLGRGLRGLRGVGSAVESLRASAAAQQQQARFQSSHAENTNTFLREVRARCRMCARAAGGGELGAPERVTEESEEDVALCAPHRRTARPAPASARIPPARVRRVATRLGGGRCRGALGRPAVGNSNPCAFAPLRKLRARPSARLRAPVPGH